MSLLVIGTKQRKVLPSDDAVKQVWERFLKGFNWVKNLCSFKPCQHSESLTQSTRVNTAMCSNEKFCTLTSSRRADSSSYIPLLHGRACFPVPPHCIIRLVRSTTGDPGVEQLWWKRTATVAPHTPGTAMKYARLSCQQDSLACFDVRSINCYANIPGGQRLSLEGPDDDSEQGPPATALADSCSQVNIPANSLLQSLPEYLINQVLDQLPPDSLMTASYVCKSWYQLIQQDQFKRKRLAWHHKSFLLPGYVAHFKAKRKILSCSAERRLQVLAERIGKTMLLQAF